MIAQFTHDQFLRVRPQGVGGQLRRLTFRCLRKLLLVFRDPLVETGIGKFRITIPLSHALPEYLSIFPLYGSNLSRIAAYVKEKYRDLSVIDIGANIGDSIAIIRSGADAPILCVEGNPIYYKTLLLNVARFSGVQAVQEYVGEARASFRAEDKMAAGTSYIAAGSGREIKMSPLTDITAASGGFIKSKLVKIDTDGFDCKIIRGSGAFLLSAKPAIFFEYDPFLLDRQGDDGLSVFEFLRGLGYDSAVVYDNLGHFMLSLQLSNSRLLGELHAHFLSYKGSRFGDLCVFHSEDSDLFDATAAKEQEYLRAAP